jgi:hypothetical protein
MLAETDRAGGARSKAHRREVGHQPRSAPRCGISAGCGQDWRTSTSPKRWVRSSSRTSAVGTSKQNHRAPCRFASASLTPHCPGCRSGQRSPLTAASLLRAPPAGRWSGYGHRGQKGRLAAAARLAPSRASRRRQRGVTAHEAPRHLQRPPYGTERSYNGLRLAGALSRRDGVELRVFLLGDAVGCAISG